MTEPTTALQRRQFLKSASATCLGVSAASLTACGNSPGTSSTPASPPADPGTFTYDAALFKLTMNLGDAALSGCTYAAESREYKVRALFHDAMYWKVMVAGKRYLQQWTRVSVSPAGDPSIVGVWSNQLGHTLTFVGDGSVSVAFSGADCGAYGYLGEDSLPLSMFLHSVAAGDPATDGFILWTRVSSAAASVNLNYEVSLTPNFTSIEASGSVAATSAIDHTVKPLITGLDPDTTYYYRFITPNDTDVGGLTFKSHTGRVKTLPIGSPTNLKIALVSCSSIPHGFFNAYRQVARRDDLDGVYHLGDYIYDYPGDPAESNPNDYLDTAATDQGRTYPEGERTETITLADYRTRFKNYREDIDLQLIHTRYSFINTWDDHETANDSFDPDGPGVEGGAENHNDNGRDEGVWEDRKAAAAQAYNEWLPITDVTSKGAGNYNDPRLDRQFEYGDLVDLIVIDTRVAGRHDVADTTQDDYEEAAREFISSEQRTFMLNALNNSTKKWKLLGQQVMMGHLLGPPLVSMSAPGTDQRWGCVINNDQWDGYDVERERIFSAIRDNSITNFVCLTGDIHTSWAIEIVDDPRKRGPLGTVANGCVGPASNQEAIRERFGVEFVTPSITSPGLPDPNGSLTTAVGVNNPHIKAVDLEQRGYSIMEITPSEITCVWYHVTTILDEEDETQTIWKAFSVADGTNVLTEIV